MGKGSSDCIFLLDVDRVLADIKQGLVDVGNAYQASRGLPAVDAGTVDAKNIRERFPGLPSNWVQEALCSDGFVTGLRVMPGARKAVSELQTLGRVYALTTVHDGSKYWYYERVQWLGHHFGMQASSVVTATDKFLVRGDMFVDDKKDNVSKWAEYNTHGIGIVWGPPEEHSQALPDKAPMVFTDSWTDVLIYARYIYDRCVDGA